MTSAKCAGGTCGCGTACCTVGGGGGAAACCCGRGDLDLSALGGLISVCWGGGWIEMNTFVFPQWHPLERHSSLWPCLCLPTTEGMSSSEDVEVCCNQCRGVPGAPPLSHCRVGGRPPGTSTVHGWAYQHSLPTP
eukprot:4619865-Amphidinium_carterae.2